MIRRPTNQEHEEIQRFLSTNGILVYIPLFGILFFIIMLLPIFFTVSIQNLKENFIALGILIIMLITLTKVTITSIKSIIKYRKIMNEIKNFNYNIIDCIMTNINLESIRNRKSHSVRHIIKSNLYPTDDIYLYSSEQQELFNKIYEIKTFHTKFQLYQDFYNNIKPTNCILVILPNNENFAFYPQIEY